MPSFPHRSLPFVVALALALVAGPALGAEFIRAYGDWDTFRDTLDGKKSCYMASVPKKAEGKYTRRGDAYVMIEHFPSAKVVGLVTVEAGYPYKKGSKVEVEIGGKTYEFYTHPDSPQTAWARDDGAVRRAMIKGERMVVRGTSRRGTRTRDTYSLKGVTAAYKAISKACGVK